VSVVFDPATVAATTGQLTFTSNSSTNPTATVSLSGTGIPAAYAVNLTWSAPSSTPCPIVGYKVFRAASGSSTYALLNSSVATATAYVDSTVVAGSAYNYIVESVDGAGVASAPSNMFAVTIP
jgi:fibronectin type 3 domain-containing protein